MAVFLLVLGLILTSFALYRARHKNYLLALTSQQLQLNQTQLQIQLEKMQKDPVTGLEAWYVFESYLQQAIKQGARYDLTMGVMYIDLDGFKILNNALGNQVGDALLKETGERLKTCIRQVDNITRQVNDRFVVLLSQLSKAETAALVAARMLEVISEPFYINEHELYLTACIGIALFPVDTKEADMLLQYAEDALYLAKQNGKHLYQFYKQELHLQSQRELLLATQLNKETFLNELQLCYQPILNMKTQKVMCMDVQLYWQHRDYGLIAPRELFAYAENQRKSTMLSDWMLKKACLKFLDWQKLGIHVDLLGLPLSLRQIENTQFIYDLTQLLKTLQFDPRYLLIEVKESLTAAAPEKFAKAVAMLKYIGVKIAITDFGSGLLPLSEFKNLNIDYLKLDPHFVNNIVDHSRTKLLVKSISAFADTLGIKLLIQGVESAEQVTVLQDLGCTLLQGQIVGGPLSEREVEDKLLEHPIA